MTIGLTDTIRTARIAQIASTIGATPVLKFYTGSMPAVGAAATGTLVGSYSLPSTWLSAGAAGVQSKAGTWSGALSTGGDIGYFRIEKSGDNTVYIQGTAGTSGTDMIIDNDVITAGQVVTVTAFTLTDGNAT